MKDISKLFDFKGLSFLVTKQSLMKKQRPVFFLAIVIQLVRRFSKSASEYTKVSYDVSRNQRQSTRKCRNIQSERCFFFPQSRVRTCLRSYARKKSYQSYQSLPLLLQWIISVSSPPLCEYHNLLVAVSRQSEGKLFGLSSSAYINANRIKAIAEKTLSYTQHQLLNCKSHH